MPEDGAEEAPVTDGGVAGIDSSSSKTASDTGIFAVGSSVGVGVVG